MLKRAITYKSYDGETVTEDFYFHISMADLAKLELTNIKDGGMEGAFRRMIESKDGRAIVEEFDKILLMAVGRKSPDGKRFVKNDEISQDFANSPAYEVIFMEMVTDAEKMASFIAACVPGDVDPKKLEELSREGNVFATPQPTPEETGDEIIAAEPKDPTAVETFKRDASGKRILTEKDVREMPDTELRHLLASGEAVLGE